MADVEQEYAELELELGDPLEHREMPEAERDYLEYRLPQRLTNFLIQKGQATYLDGAVTVCRPSEFAPILSLIFKGDHDFSHHDCTTVSYGAFGELSIWSKKHGQVNVSLVEGLIFSQRLAPTEFRAGFLPKKTSEPDPNIVASYSVISRSDKADFLDFKGAKMLDRCIATHGRLALGECYGFFPALALTGFESPQRSVENIRRVPALEHFAILAQMQPFYLANVGPSGIQRLREIG